VGGLVSGTAASPEVREALSRAREAYAKAVPVTPREQMAKAFAMNLWLGDWAARLGPEGLDDLARRLEPIRKEWS
jgi:hypothetical protein